MKVSAEARMGQGPGHSTGMRTQVHNVSINYLKFSCIKKSKLKGEPGHGAVGEVPDGPAVHTEVAALSQSAQPSPAEALRGGGDMVRPLEGD